MKKSLFVALGITPIVLGGGFLTNHLYQSFLDQQDKQRFLLVQKDMTTLRDRLNDSTVELRWEITSTCERSRLKFKEGAPACSILVSASKKVKDENEARTYINLLTKFFENTDDFVANSKYHIPLEKYKDFPAELKPGFSGQNFEHKDTDMVCGSAFEIEDTFGEPATNEFIIRFRCNGFSRDTWFPSAID